MIILLSFVSEFNSTKQMSTKKEFKVSFTKSKFVTIIHSLFQFIYTNPIWIAKEQSWNVTFNQISLVSTHHWPTQAPKITRTPNYLSRQMSVKFLNRWNLIRLQGNKCYDWGKANLKLMLKLLQVAKDKTELKTHKSTVKEHQCNFNLLLF